MEIPGAHIHLPGMEPGSPALQLRSGQLLRATVNSVQGDQVQLNLASQGPVLARSTASLQEGQQLQLQVQGRTSEGTIVLQIMPAAAPPAANSSAVGHLQRLGLSLTENNLLLAQEMEAQGQPLTRAGMQFLSGLARDAQLNAWEARAMVWLAQNSLPLEKSLVRPLSLLFSGAPLREIGYLRETLQEVVQQIMPQTGTGPPTGRALQAAVERLEQLVLEPGQQMGGREVARLLQVLGLDREASLARTLMGSGSPAPQGSGALLPGAGAAIGTDPGLMLPGGSSPSLYRLLLFLTAFRDSGTASPQSGAGPRVSPEGRELTLPDPGPVFRGLPVASASHLPGGSASMPAVRIMPNLSGPRIDALLENLGSVRAAVPGSAPAEEGAWWQARPGPALQDTLPWPDLKSRLLQAAEILQARDQQHLSVRVENAVDTITGLQLLQAAAGSEQSYWDMHLLGWLFFPGAEAPWLMSARVPEPDGSGGGDRAQEVIFFTSPPIMGGVLVELRRWDDVMTASLTVEKESTRDLVEAERSRLVRSLEDLPYQVNVLPCRLYSGPSLRESWLRRVMGQVRWRQMDIRV